MSRIAEHAWQDGACIYCKVTAEQSEKSCIFRDAPPRPVPESIFADLGAIGDELARIKREEGRAESSV